MNNYLDKLIGDDELLTYICLILAIFNILLISMIINDIENYFSIYIFILFVVLFLIFIVYFLLKNKDQILVDLLSLHGLLFLHSLQEKF